jgi:GLPGLI family protein
MKKSILTLLLVLCCQVLINAQITEGHFTYKIDVSSDEPDMQMALGMMQGSKMDLYFKDKMTRVEMNMGAMMNFTSITNENDGTILTLMGGVMGKNAIQSTIEETEKMNADKMPKYEVTFSDETKTIEGYNCKKAILTDEEGNESVFWYTEEISISKRGQNFMNEEIPGMAMQYDMNNNGIKMTMTVSKIEKSLNDSKSLFDMTVPSGYKIMTPEEMKAMGM